MLRGALGATGVAGASLVGSGLLEPSYAAFPKFQITSTGRRTSRASG